MRKLSLVIVALGVFCLASVAFAAERKDFTEFSIELPDGWEAPMEPQRAQGAVAAVFMTTKDGKIGNVTVSFAPSAGQSMEDLVNVSKKNMEQQGVTLAVAEQSDTRVVYTGNMAGMDMTMICALDPDKQELGVLVYMGQGAEGVAKSVQPANANLKFF